MRELKFRIWDKQSKQFFPTSSDGGVFALAGALVAMEAYLGTTKNAEDEILERFEFMQFTGLKDKNGKEIYEGDLINLWHFSTEGEEHLAGENLEVVWRSQSAMFGLRDYDEKTDYPMKVDVDEEGEVGVHEVVGNIYESKGLLE